MSAAGYRGSELEGSDVWLDQLVRQAACELKCGGLVLNCNQAFFQKYPLQVQVKFGAS